MNFSIFLNYHKNSFSKESCVKPGLRQHNIILFDNQNQYIYYISMYVREHCLLPLVLRVLSKYLFANEGSTFQT